MSDRRTGKTFRLLMDTLKEASAGYDVFIVVQNRNHKKFILSSLISIVNSYLIGVIFFKNQSKIIFPPSPISPGDPNNSGSITVIIDSEMERTKGIRSIKIFTDQQ